MNFLLSGLRTARFWITEALRLKMVGALTNCFSEAESRVPWLDASSHGTLDGCASS